jgi:hypothetical protein
MDRVLATIRPTSASHRLRGAETTLEACEAKLPESTLSDDERNQWNDAKNQMLQAERESRAELEELAALGVFPSPPAPGMS